MFETLFVLFVGGIATNAVSRSRRKDQRDLASALSQPISAKPQTFKPLSPESIALGKKAYLGPMTAKRRKALQNARRKRKQS